MAKLALLIGVSEYQEGLNPLPSAVKDIEAVQHVLQNPEIGGFDEVTVFPNPEPMAMQEAVENLFSGRKKDDLVLFFFSGHGVKDDRGRLYFATRETRKNTRGELVKATAVPASFVQDIMSNVCCKRQIVILDCCFSGAFAEGMTAKDDGMVDIQTQLGGEGRAVLTSSTSTQYSFEQKGSDLSVYTQYIVEGMESGAADLDNDGSISIDELHDYARKKVQEAAPAMKPKIYTVEEGFKIRVAKVRIGDPKLSYRKEVGRHASQGAISGLGRRILDDLRDKLGLNYEDADAIEEEVFKPYWEYKEKLRRYDQAFVEAIALENHISVTTREELHRYQVILGLREEDISPIERKYSTQRINSVTSPSFSKQTELIVKRFFSAGIKGNPQQNSSRDSQSGRANSLLTFSQNLQEKVGSTQEAFQNHLRRSFQTEAPLPRKRNTRSKEKAKRRNFWIVSSSFFSIILTVALFSLLNKPANTPPLVSKQPSANKPITESKQIPASKQLTRRKRQPVQAEEQISKNDQPPMHKQRTKRRRTTTNNLPENNQPLTDDPVTNNDQSLASEGQLRRKRPSAIEQAPKNDTGTSDNEPSAGYPAPTNNQPTEDAQYSQPPANSQASNSGQ
jgi:Caspase domain